MKDLQLLTWLTQLGLGTAVPLTGFVLLALWLQKHFHLGIWVLFVGIGLGLVFAIDAFIKNLKLLGKLTREKKEKTPPVSFGEHQ